MKSSPRNRARAKRTRGRAPELLDARDLAGFAAGRHDRAYGFLGAHPRRAGEVPGVVFAVWAPRASHVSVVGDFNAWDGRRHPMRLHDETGVWECFVPGLTPGALYKYEVTGCDGRVMHKADPFGFAAEVRPATASRIWFHETYAWKDEAWMLARRGQRLHDQPLNVYEVHAGSWKRHRDGAWLGYGELADQLIPYALDMGFTHIELLPVAEHALDASWGYQTTGYYAPTARYGSPDQFKEFVDRCHQAGLGVLLDWVPGHFPKDEAGLARFDGAALYEHVDPRRGEQPDWGTYVFDYGRPAVCSFLWSNALFWAEIYHVDGLRVDAVASMLYLDFSRPPGGWEPNRHGGNEHLEAMAFLRELNTRIQRRYPGFLVLAEESTAWPKVSHPAAEGGLGFSFKWNLGWMNDTLRYMSRSPAERKAAHDLLLLPMSYAFSEHFILPLSHDEVVHGKRPMLEKMPGSRDEQWANLRLLYAWQYAHPGKKLLFMGNEFGVTSEWNEEGSLDWSLSQKPRHAGLRRLVRDLSHGYCREAAWHCNEADAGGFEWIEKGHRDLGVLAFIRRSRATQQQVVCVFHFHSGTPLFRLGLRDPGDYEVFFDSEATAYGGRASVPRTLTAEAVPCHDRPWSALLRLRPLSALFLRRKENGPRA